jgi:hypothetical protein
VSTRKCLSQSKEKEIPVNIFEESDGRVVNCKQWFSTDRSTLQTSRQSDENFLDILID